VDFYAAAPETFGGACRLTFVSQESQLAIVPVTPTQAVARGRNRHLVSWILAVWSLHRRKAGSEHAFSHW